MTVDHSVFSLELNSVDEDTKPVHEPVHGIATFYCEQCEFKSNKKKYVKKHFERLHGKLKNVTHACDQCEYTATLKGNLKTHIELKHGTVTYSLCVLSSIVWILFYIHIVHKSK